MPLFAPSLMEQHQLCANTVPEGGQREDVLVPIDAGSETKLSSLQTQEEAVKDVVRSELSDKCGESA